MRFLQGVTGHPCTPSRSGVETGGLLQVQDQLELHSEFWEGLS